jgi:hypothetical protein
MYRKTPSPGPVYMPKVGGLTPNALHTVSWFSLAPIKTDRHHIIEKLLRMVKNFKQTNKILRLVTGEDR